MVKQRDHRIPVGAIASIAAIAIAAGGGAAWWTWNSTRYQSQNSVPQTQQPSSPPIQPSTQTAQVFWLKDTGNKLELVPQLITANTNQPSNTLETAFSNLLAGPNDAAVSTNIPKGTKLKDVKVEQDGIHVNLSQEFSSGGGSASMMGRVAQVLYTATSLQPTAKVWVEVEGKPLDVLGGEGVELQQPLTRQSFEANFTL